MFFEKVFGPILAPFRAIRNKWVGVKSIKGSLQADVSRAKGLGTNVQNMAKPLTPPQPECLNLRRSLVQLMSPTRFQPDAVSGIVLAF